MIRDFLLKILMMRYGTSILSAKAYLARNPNHPGEYAEMSGMSPMILE